MIELEPHQWEMLGRYLGAGIALGMGGLGAALGMGNAAGAASNAMMRQPTQQGELRRTMLIGQAITGDASIFALVVGLFILFFPAVQPEEVGGNFFAAMTGAGIAIGFGAFGSGFGCGFAAANACAGVARNPRRAGQTTQSMIIGQAVAQSPSIFALVVALILIIRQAPGTDLATMGVCIGAGIAMGVSAIGSGMGSGQTAGGAVLGLSRWPRSYGVTLRTMLIGQAVCETPAIFGMLVAFIMMFAMQDIPEGILGFAHMLAAGIAVGFGGIGPGIGSGLTSGPACVMAATYPRRDTLILRTMLIGQAVAQSTAIYALIIALAILYVV
ncbi:MAG: ATP synthase F0 subunit C [Candidatus Hydrogenedens sp.]|nr:ATP synthase F0 subunit C [Candidatus Hydrogenedens sp.]